MSVNVVEKAFFVEDAKNNRPSVRLGAASKFEGENKSVTLSPGEGGVFPILWMCIKLG